MTDFLHNAQGTLDELRQRIDNLHEAHRSMERAFCCSRREFSLEPAQDWQGLPGYSYINDFREQCMDVIRQLNLEEKRQMERLKLQQARREARLRIAKRREEYM